MTERPSLLELYRRMVRIRCFEEAVARRFRRGELPGFVHLSVGQEAVAVGVTACLTPRDQITTTHRGHGHVIAKGADLRKLAAELYGAPDGACRGVGGSMHLVDIGQGVLCAGAIVGGTIPLATGAAFSFAYRGEPAVAVSFFGDGAVNQGVLHESLNIASLWNLPVVYVCENNGYAEMTPASVHTRVQDLTAHARIYGIATATVDGNDVEAVQEAARAAIERARRGDGPAFLECRTYRTRGHFEGDPQRYKPADEAKAWEARDPIRVCEMRLRERGEVTEATLERVRNEVQREVEVAFADLTTATRLAVRDLEELTYVHAPSDAGGTS